MQMEHPCRIEPTLFLDMDGVLADFIGGLVKHYGVKETKERMVPHGEVEEYVGRTWDNVKDTLRYTHDFFRNLPLMPYAKDLLHEVRQMEEEGLWEGGVFIATHAVRGDPGCRDAKYAWLLHHAGEYFAERMIVFSGEADKKLLAGPDRVLVDDYAVNVVNWKERGGDAIHFIPYRSAQLNAAWLQHKKLLRKLRYRPEDYL